MNRTNDYSASGTSSARPEWPDPQTTARRPAARTTPTMPARVGAILLAMALLISGCTKILDADFDWYIADQVPEGQLPGPPSGDKIATNGAVKVSEAGGLQMLFGPDTSDAAYAALVPGGQPHDTGDYYISFVGHRSDMTPTRLVCILRSSQSKSPVLALSSGEFELESGDGKEIIGQYDTSIPHAVLLHLDLTHQRLHLIIRQEGKEPITVEDKPFPTEGFDELHELVFVLSSSIQPITIAQYLVDDIEISMRL